MIKVYALTGEIGSGKTTALLDSIKKNRQTDGVLTLNINGKRILYFIRTQEQTPLDATAGEKYQTIGKYKFSANKFELANNYLMNIDFNKYKTVILDEIGPLELDGLGFHKAIEFLLSNKNRELKLIFVVRNSLYEKVVNNYKLAEYSVVRINTEQLPIVL